MNRWEKFKNWIASLASVGGVPVPTGGRSSVDETLANRMSAFMTSYQELAPGLNFEVLCTLKLLYLFNPDFSQAVANFIALANTGHQIVIEAAGVRQGQAAIARLNEAAKRIYPHSDGVDGLIRDLLAQVCWSGAVSREDEVDLSLARVKQVLLVSPEEVRFYPEAGEWRAYQEPKNSWLGMVSSSPSALINGIALHPTTYRYYAIEKAGPAPYAKPPFTAALNAILKTQEPMLASLRSAAEKLGVMGLYTAEVTPPVWDRSKETWAEFQKRGQDLLISVRKAFEEAAKSGTLKNFIATFRDQKVNVTSTTGDARGAAQLFNLNEEQVSSGLHTFPLFLGRTFSVTEALAGVLYHVYASQPLNFQRLVKRSIERTYELDLSLAGIQVDGVSVKFNPIRGHNELQQAQADEIRQRIIFSDAEHGMIDADQAAQQRGYDKAANPEMLNGAPRAVNEGAGGLSARASSFIAELRYDSAVRAYRFLVPRIEVSTAGLADAENVYDFKKKVRLKRSS